jgi:hypothetical protein
VRPAPPTQRHSYVSQTDTAPVLGILTSLASEIQRLNASVGHHVQPRGQQFDTASASSQDINDGQSPSKRRRLDDSTISVGILQEDGAENCDLSRSLPSDEVTSAVMDIFFPRICPWLPIIHENRFRRSLLRPEGRRRNAVVLHAMFVAASRHLDPENHDLTKSSMKSMCKRSRNLVMAASMANLSLENVQAAAILALMHVSPNIHLGLSDDVRELITLYRSVTENIPVLGRS